MNKDRAWLNMNRTILSPTGCNTHECGYCKSGDPASSVSYGFISKQMLVTDYEHLMLRGWRRCGTYFYKPVMHVTCCPMYSIRLEVSKFQISKSHKKVLKNVQKKANSKSNIPRVDTKTTNAGGVDEEIVVMVELASFTDEKLELYRRYQVAVHKDAPESITEEGFTSFLVTSPLVDNVSHNGNVFGTFHHCYRLRGMLIAVGVVDLLPSGLSSVYCFYDNDKRDLVLGKYTALKEIDWCKEHTFQFYYMGYYIHNCDKMKYKGEYKPSELLCPTTMKWFDLESSIPLLEKHAFTPLDPSLAEARSKISTANHDSLQDFIFKEAPVPDLNRVPLLIGNAGRLLSLKDMSPGAIQYLGPILQELLEYVGAEVVFRSIAKF